MHQRLKQAIGVTLAIAAFPVLARADNPISINDVFGRFGYTTERVSGSACSMVMTIDRKAYIEAVPQLKAIHMLNPEYVTQSRMNLEPTGLALGFALQMAPTVVKELYDNDKAANICSFRQLIRVQDEYGNDQTEDLFTFNFSRELYKRINWEKFAAENLPKVAAKFTPGISTMRRIQREREIAGE